MPEPEFYTAKVSRRQRAGSQTAHIAHHAHNVHPLASPANLSQNSVQRAVTNPHALSPNDILQFQRTAGNHAVQRLLAGKGKSTVNAAGLSAPTVQRALKVGAANDLYEQEAGRVARQVAGTPQPSPLGESAQPQRLVQRQTQGSFDAGSDFESRLKQSEGSGKALPEKTRAEFEPKFGTDLSGVRIHTTSQSNALNRSIQAKAFTHGNDIHFSQGAYNPHSSQGKQILAHELTHTIQQTGGASLHDKGSGIQRSPKLTPASDKTIQRLTIKVKDLAGTESLATSFIGLFGAGSGDIIFDDIKNTLGLYERSKSRRHKLRILQGLVHATSEWLSRHSSAEEIGTEKYTLINDLLEEVVVEIPKVSAMIKNKNKKAQDSPAPTPDKGIDVNKHAGWEMEDEAGWGNRFKGMQGIGPKANNRPKDDMDFRKWEKKNLKGQDWHKEHKNYAKNLIGEEFGTTNFDYLSDAGHKHAKAINETLNFERKYALPNDPNAPFAKKLHKLMIEFKLTRAEALALAIYTSPDYLTMNPSMFAAEHAVAGEERMQKNLVDKEMFAKQPNDGRGYAKQATNDVMEDVRGKEEIASKEHAAAAKKEGLQHSKFLLSGLKKLPDVKATVYRGMGLTQDLVDQQFVAGNDYSSPGFSSTSKLIDKAALFASTRANEVNGRAVLLTMHVTQAKNLSKFSLHPGEKERLVMPHAKFRVQKVGETADMPVQNLVVPGGRLVTAELTQIEDKRI